MSGGVLDQLDPLCESLMKQGEVQTHMSDQSDPLYELPMRQVEVQIYVEEQG